MTDRRWGITIPLAGVPLHAHRDWFARLAGEGYTDVWSSETNAHDAFTPLAMAAAWEPSLRLGVAVVPVYTRGPALLAQSVAALADAAPGRVAVGLGASSPAIVERWNGLEFDRPYQRVRDTLRFLRTALTGEKVTHDYETFSVRGFRLGVRPPEPPALLLGALRSGMLRLAGSEADGAVVNWLSPDDVRTVVPHVGEGREIAVRLFVIPTADAEAARGLGRRMIAEYLNVPVYAAFHEWLGRGELLTPMWEAWRSGDRAGALEAVPDAVVDDLVIHGSPEACRERVEAYVDAGITTPMPMVIAPPDQLPEVIHALGPGAP